MEVETHVARGSAVPHLCLQWEENKRTRERERDRESRRIGRGKGKLRRGQAQGKGCSRRSREVPAGGSSEPDRESTRRCAQLIVLGTRARVPFGCCCRGRLVHAMEPTWASRTRLRSCPCLSVVPLCVRRAGTDPHAPQQDRLPLHPDIGKSSKSRLRPRPAPRGPVRSAHCGL